MAKLVNRSNLISLLNPTTGERLPLFSRKHWNAMVEDRHVSKRLAFYSFPVISHCRVSLSILLPLFSALSSSLIEGVWFILYFWFSAKEQKDPKEFGSQLYKTASCQNFRIRNIRAITTVNDVQTIVNYNNFYEPHYCVLFGTQWQVKRYPKIRSVPKKVTCSRVYLLLSKYALTSSKSQKRFWYWFH